MRPLPLLAFLAACASAPEAAPPIATPDTLPDGTTAVTSTAPADSGRWAWSRSCVSRPRESVSFAT
jgi:hypothetical protein